MIIMMISTDNIPQKLQGLVSGLYVPYIRTPFVRSKTLKPLKSG